jgi:predicted nucleic acid-binding protein
MICADTTVLIDEFRAKGDLSAAVNRALLAHGAEELVVPFAAAGEFLDGAASVSEPRFQEALSLLRRRRIIAAGLDVAGRYSRIASVLRKSKTLAGRSHNDLWIAATANHLGARVLTRNPEHFRGFDGLEVVAYER